MGARILLAVCDRFDVCVATLFGYRGDGSSTHISCVERMTRVFRERVFLDPVHCCVCCFLVVVYFEGVFFVLGVGF